MPRVTLIASRNPFGGSCEYLDFQLFSSSKEPYDQDRWVYHIDGYSIRCTAYKSVIEVDGYFPDHNWIRVDFIAIPDFRVKANFTIDEKFDESGRVGSEETSLTVQYSPQDRVVRMRVGSGDHISEVFVSPHTDLILGAGGEPLQLRDIYFLNVAGLPK